jgi:hypothetical protein
MCGASLGAQRGLAPRHRLLCVECSCCEWRCVSVDKTEWGVCLVAAHTLLFYGSHTDPVQIATASTSVRPVVCVVCKMLGCCKQSSMLRLLQCPTSRHFFCYKVPTATVPALHQLIMMVTAPLSQPHESKHMLINLHRSLTLHHNGWLLLPPQHCLCISQAIILCSSARCAHCAHAGAADHTSPHQADYSQPQPMAFTAQTAWLRTANSF